MRLLSQAIAQKLFLDSFPQVKPDTELAKEVGALRDELVKRTDKALVFLFSTLVIISLFQFKVISNADLFGIEISHPDVFIFVAFLVGNALYVSSTGAFLKVFLLEFYLFYIVTDKDFDGSKITSGFLYSYHANIFALLSFNRTLENATRFARVVFSFTGIYSRYALLILYSIFYFLVLFSYLSDIWRTPPNDPSHNIHRVFSFILVVSNVLSAITSCTVFLPAKAGAYAARQGRLAEKEKLRANGS